MQDWITISWLSLLIVLIIGIAEGIRRFAGWPSEFTRKFVHITVGIISVVTVALLQSALPMILIAGSFGLINLIALRNGFLKSMHGARPSYGTAYFPLAFSVLLILAFPTHKLIIIAAMLVLTFGDAAAAIVGESIGKPGEYVLIRDPKPWHGSLAMLLVTTATLFFLLKYDLFSLGYSYTSFESFWYALATALVATAAEALSHKGSDNLSVPFATAIILYFFIEHSQTENIQLTQAILYAFIAAAISLKLRFLAPSGAVALFLLAVPIFGFGGWQWSIPILTFFVLSSLLSKIGKAKKAKQDDLAEKESRRDYAQAFANGGVAGILMVAHMFYENELLFFLYLAALAAATADTWATEIGSLSKQQPYLITNGKAVPAGTSGAVTNLGLFSSFAGAFVIALSGIIYQPSMVNQSFELFLFVVAAGFLASLFDSLLGATVQLKYISPKSGKVTEAEFQDGERTEYLSGWKWLNNNAVNFLCTVSAIFFYILFLLLTFIQVLLSI